jgi:hypothetical protein
MLAETTQAPTSCFLAIQHVALVISVEWETTSPRIIPCSEAVRSKNLFVLPNHAAMLDGKIQWYELGGHRAQVQGDELAGSRFKTIRQWQERAFEHDCHVSPFGWAASPLPLVEHQNL